MKLNKLALTLTAAALLPTFAFAGTDEVAASFERDMYREPVKSTVAITGITDSLVDSFNIALNGTNDQVLASFERDLYRKPMASKNTLSASVSDPLIDEINVALRSDVAKPVIQAITAASYRKGS